MSRRVKASFIEELQKGVDEYIRSGQRWPATTRDVATWLIDRGYWAPQRAEMISLCAEHISRALREEYITDPQGRVVRAKHAATIRRGSRQLSLWADIRTASRRHMEVAFKQRRNQIVSDCRQLKTDVDSYNENYNRGGPIQMEFDFRSDLEELEAVG